MSILKELDVVRLIKSFDDLEKGTQGIIVHKYDDCNFEIEFIDGNGKTIDVVTTPKDVIELVLSY